MEKKYEIWIEYEAFVPGQWDIYDDNTDVIVTFEDGFRWVASFFTYKHIETLRKSYELTGECMNGKYFYATDMILVDELSRNRIESVIDYMIKEEVFESAFTPIGLEEDFETDEN